MTDKIYTLFLPPIIDRLSQYMSLEDLNNLRCANNLKYLNCQIPISDPDHQILSTNKICDLIVSISKLGSKKLFFNAVNQSDYKSVKFLLTHGYNPNLKNDVGYTPLLLAGQFNDFKVFKLLIKHKANIYENNSLIWAVLNGKAQMVKLLLETGADPNQQNDRGETALLWASRLNNYKIVKLLLTNNTNPNQKDCNDETALIWACQKGNHEIIKLLIAHQSEINQQNYAGRSALMFAIEENDKHAVKLLLEARADINQTEMFGKNSLTIASEHGHLEIIKLIAKF